MSPAGEVLADPHCRRSRPPQPAAHRRRRPVDQLRRPPEARAPRRGQQRRADHRHRINAANQSDIIEQHVRLLARPAPRPAGTQLNWWVLLGSEPTRPGEPPRAKDAVTRRARQQAGNQLGLDASCVASYDEHDASGHHREDPLVLDQRISEGVLARTGPTHAVVSPATTQPRHHAASVITIPVAKQRARSHQERRSTSTYASRARHHSERIKSHRVSSRTRRTSSAVPKLSSSCSS